MSASRLAVLGHELRSPVAALVAIAETLSRRRESLAPADVRRLLELALVAGRDVERIVVDVAPTALRCQRVELSRLVADAVLTAGLRGAAVRGTAEPDLPAIVADPVRLRQALASLIANAVAHAPTGTQIVVTASARAGAVELAVSDAGEGIRPDRQAAIFEPGVRFAARPGQGIGLAVAREIAEAHGGWIEVDSAPGRGTTFRLVLPPAAGAPA